MDNKIAEATPNEAIAAPEPTIEELRTENESLKADIAVLRKEVESRKYWEDYYRRDAQAQQKKADRLMKLFDTIKAMISLTMGEEDEA